MNLKSLLIAVLILGGTPTLSGAQPVREASRGELLYSTHCIACHTTQVHWRAQKTALDWTGLQAAVRRWQKASGLDWADADIGEVAQYLNTLHYHYPEVD